MSAPAAASPGVRGGPGARPQLAVAAGAVTIAFSSILVELSAASPSTAAVFRCLYALPALGALAWWEGRRYGRRSARDRGLALAAGTFFAADLVLWHHAIEDVGAGLATVLGNTQVVVVPLLAWALLRERPGRRVPLAIAIVLVGVLLISGALEEAAFGEHPARGVVFGVLTGLTYAGFILVLRQGSDDRRRPAGPLFEATAVATVVALGAGLVVGDLELAPSWPTHGWLLALALSSQVLGWLVLAVALPRLPAALGSITLTLQPVGSVLLGVVLLGEDPSALQLAGVGCVLLGLLVVASGRGRSA